MPLDPNLLAGMVFAFSVTFVAIAAGIFNSRLKRRDEKGAALGAANRELDRKVERLEQANAEMALRLQNLETIVVSQAWNAAEAERPRLVAVPHEIPATEEMNRQRAEQLARRLGG